jgi:hypothetical protein
MAMRDACQQALALVPPVMPLPPTSAIAAEPQGGPGWILVANPRFGTIDAKADEREYGWVLEDRATGMTVADPGIARKYLPAPGPISPEQRLAGPAISGVVVKPRNAQSLSVMNVDSNACRLKATQEVPKTPVVGSGFWSFPIGGVIGIAIETEKARARQWNYSSRMALEEYRACMIERDYEVDGVSTIPKATGIIATIEAECAAEWPDDSAKRQECETDRLDSLRRGIRR